MERILGNKVEAALLYGDFDTYEASGWLKLVNEFAASFGVSFERTKHERSPHYLHMHGNGMTVEISCCHEPIDNSFFSNALGSEVTRRSFPQAAPSVAGHRSYLHVIITNGENAPPDPFLEDEFEPAKFEPSGFEFAVSLLRIMLALQTARSIPLAVYWAQCDRLFGIKEFLKLAIDVKNTSLLVHPIYFTEEADADGQEKLGIQTYGAHNLIGREVVFSPSTIPVDELHALVMHYICITRNTGLYLPNGDVFGRDETEEIVVTYLETDDTQSPAMLSFLYSEQHGIDRRPVEPEETEQAFDPEDPAEKALQEKIAEMARETEALTAEVQEPANDEEVSAFQKALHAESTGNHKKVDVNQLRVLAGIEPTSHNDDDAMEIAPKPKKRLGGFFSRKN